MIYLYLFLAFIILFRRSIIISIKRVIMSRYKGKTAMFVIDAMKPKSVGIKVIPVYAAAI